MSKFCGNCGTELQDDAVVCHNCGMNVAPAAQTKDSTVDPNATPAEKFIAVAKEKCCWAVEKLKSDKKLAGIVLGSVVGVIGVIVALCLIFGGGYEKALDKYVDSTYYGDIDAYFDSVPDDALDYSLDQLGMTKDEFKELLEESSKTQIESYKSVYGDDYSVKYKVTDEEEMDDDDLDDLRDELKEQSIAKKSVSKAYEIEVEFIIKGDKHETTSTLDFDAVKIDGDWYIF